MLQHYLRSTPQLLSCTHLPILNRRVTYSVLNVSVDTLRKKQTRYTTAVYGFFQSLHTNVRMVIYEQYKTCIISYTAYIREVL